MRFVQSISLRKFIDSGKIKKKMRGKVRLDKRTKRLVQRLEKGEIAVIDHSDIDSASAYLLLEKKPRAVINASPSITGTYPALGAKILLEHKIPIIDEVGEEIFHKIREGDVVEIRGGEIVLDGEVVGKGKILTLQEVEEKIKEGERNLDNLLEDFVGNTLQFLRREKEFFLSPEFFQIPLRTRIEGKEVMVVIRGRDYKEDLRALRPYIEEVKPVLIGVDGGADALLEMGYKPHIIIGDMDSASDEVLLSGAELVVHAYLSPEKGSPGLERIKKLGLDAHTIAFPGLSEDLALLLAFHQGAKLIVAVGTHYDLVDFLDKRRKGMSSTFLTRLKVGARLVDAKGVSYLYRKAPRPIYLLLLIFASAVPITILLSLFPPLRDFLRLVFLRIWTLFRF